jgi:hypothetical protein
MIFFRNNVVDRSLGQRTKMMERPYCGAIMIVTYCPLKNGLKIYSAVSKKQMPFVPTGTSWTMEHLMNRNKQYMRITVMLRKHQQMCIAAIG